jgi:phenylalanyl-tRNA synthetase beta chain
MPTASFLLQDLKTFLDTDPQGWVDQAFNYGLEATVQGDILDVDVTADRPDLLAIEGFARAIKVYGGQKRSLPPSLRSSDRRVVVEESVLSLRPFLAAIVVEDLTLTPASLQGLLQFQEKVSQTFGRQRKKAAIGIYDLSKIEGDLIYRAVDWEEIQFIPLGETTPQTPRQILEHHPKGQQYRSALPAGSQVPILEDERGRVLALPPIINGAIVGEITCETNALLIDVTGTNEKTVQELASILAHNFIDRGATVKTVTIETPAGDRETPDLSPRRIPFSAKILNERLGTAIPKLDLEPYLDRMNLTIAGSDLIEAPSYRTDLLSEIDVAGDLLAAIGLDNLQVDYSDFHFSLGKADRLKAFTLQVGDWAQRMGLLEVKSYILTDPEILTGFVGNPVPLLSAYNARSRSHSTARPTLQAGLLEILARNIQAPKPLQIYEVGEVIVPLMVSPSEAETETEHTFRETFRETVNWGFAVLDSQASFTIAKSYTQTLLKALNIAFELTACQEPQYVPQRSATVLVNGHPAGHFGEIHPELLERFSFPEPVCAGELNIEQMLGVKR